MNADAKRWLAEGVAALGPADHALLALTVDRGLPDERIAQLTGVEKAAVTARRERLLATLAEHVGLSVPEVLILLRTAGDDDSAMSDTPPGGPSAPRRRALPSIAGRHTRTRTRAATAALALAAVIAAVMVALLGTTHSRHAPTATLEAGTTTTVTSTAPPPATTTITAAHTSAAHPGPRVVLRPLPGGPRRASGTARLTRRGPRLILILKVRGLRHHRRGHYEAYLYDSVLDSRALGRVRVGRVVRLPLPRDARRFRSIDISVQPRGVRNDSGESRLRGPNPARQAHGRGRPSRKRSTR